MEPPLYKADGALSGVKDEIPLRPGARARSGEDVLVDLRSNSQAEPEEVARYIVELERRLAAGND